MFPAPAKQRKVFVQCFTHDGPAAHARPDMRPQGGQHKAEPESHGAFPLDRYPNVQPITAWRGCDSLLASLLPLNTKGTPPCDATIFGECSCGEWDGGMVPS